MRIDINAFNQSPEERDAAALDKELQAIHQRENAPQRVKVAEAPRPEITEERRASHNENRNLPASHILAKLKEELHAVWVVAEVVGKWVWITTPDKPSVEVRSKLYDLGFSWNFKRQCWQNPCGAFIACSKGDPRMKYMSAKASEIEGAVNIVEPIASAPANKQLAPA